MRYFRNMVFALVAFLWLPISAHCQIEALTGLEFLACSAEAGSSSDQDSHCDGQGCCPVERSQYLAGYSHLKVAAPTLVLTLSAPILVMADALPAEISLGMPTAAPPEAVQTWQFLSRTALPVRAPSLAS